MSDQRLFKSESQVPLHYRQDQTTLIEARQSLLSYAALYPWLYGPQGAGPGHLPCPDTDNPAQGKVFDHRGISNTDGPNPPCGKHSVASGKLPRHVRLSDRRYAFHTEPEQRATYRVSGEFINNPVNRIVNPSIVDSQAKFNLAAVVELPVAAKDLPGARVVLTHQVLLRSTLPSVAAWLIDKSQTLSRSWCDEVVPDVEISFLNNGNGFNALRCTRFVAMVERCPHEQALLLAMDNLPETDSCAADVLASLSLDGVPAARHWFVRNQWSEWFEFEKGEECTINRIDADPCLLQFVLPFGQLNRQARDDLLVDQPRVRMHWGRLEKP